MQFKKIILRKTRQIMKVTAFARYLWFAFVTSVINPSPSIPTSTLIQFEALKNWNCGRTDCKNLWGILFLRVISALGKTNLSESHVEWSFLSWNSAFIGTLVAQKIDLFTYLLCSKLLFVVFNFCSLLKASLMEGKVLCVRGSFCSVITFCPLGLSDDGFVYVFTAT